MTSQDSSLAGLLARYQVAGGRRMWLKAVDSATERGDDRGRAAAERALAQLPDIDVLDSIRAGADLVRLISGWRWLDIRQAREEGRSFSEIGAALGMSKQAAWELYNTAIEHQERYVPDLHDADRARAALGDAEPIPDPPLVSTTELDWTEQARRDGWQLTDGVWQHDDRDDAYDDGDWVYLGDLVWEDVHIASLTPDDRRDALTAYRDVRRPDQRR